MKRIGIFGGSFNPVTSGHLLVARAALEEAQLDRLFFVPAAQSPFKPEIELAPAEFRCRLLRLALAGWPQCEVDTQEIERGGVSYTVDTVREYHRRFPEAKLFWLIGADHVSCLPQWRDAAALAELVEFLIIPRPGESNGNICAPFRGQWLEGFPLKVSASQIRARIKARLPVTGLVPDVVAEAISKSGLYF